MNITGKWYGRADDSEFDFTQVAGVYWCFVLSDYFVVTADLQYMEDKFNDAKEDIEGPIFGVRGTVEF